MLSIWTSLRLCCVVKSSKKSSGVGGGGKGVCVTKSLDCVGKVHPLNNYVSTKLWLKAFCKHCGKGRK